MKEFKKNEAVSHTNKYGINNDYFVRYTDETKLKALVSDGNDCYERVNSIKLREGHQ